MNFNDLICLTQEVDYGFGCVSNMIIDRFIHLRLLDYDLYLKWVTDGICSVLDVYRPMTSETLMKIAKRISVKLSCYKEVEGNFVMDGLYIPFYEYDSVYTVIGKHIYVNNNLLTTFWVMILNVKRVEGLYFGEDPWVVAKFRSKFSLEAYKELMILAESEGLVNEYELRITEYILKNKRYPYNFGPLSRYKNKYIYSKIAESIKRHPPFLLEPDDCKEAPFVTFKKIKEEPLIFNGPKLPEFVEPEISLVPNPEPTLTPYRKLRAPDVDIFTMMSNDQTVTALRIQDEIYRRQARALMEDSERLGLTWYERNTVVKFGPNMYGFYDPDKIRLKKSIERKENYRLLVEYEAEAQGEPEDDETYHDRRKMLYEAHLLRCESLEADAKLKREEIDKKNEEIRSRIKSLLDEKSDIVKNFVDLKMSDDEFKKVDILQLCLKIKLPPSLLSINGKKMKGYKCSYFKQYIAHKAALSFIPSERLVRDKNENKRSSYKMIAKKYYETVEKLENAKNKGEKNRYKARLDKIHLPKAKNIKEFEEIIKSLAYNEVKLKKSQLKAELKVAKRNGDCLYFIRSETKRIMCKQASIANYARAEDIMVKLDPTYVRRINKTQH